MTSLKKISYFLVVFLAAMFIVAGISQPVQAGANDKPRIGLITQWLESDSPGRMVNRLKPLCKKEGWPLTITGTRGNEQQLIDTCLTWIRTRSVDVIWILFPSVGPWGREMIPAAKKAGIPIIVTNGWVPGVTCDIGCDNWTAEAKCMRYVLNRLERKGNIVRLHWTGNPGLRPLDAVFEAFLKVYPELKEVAKHHSVIPGQIEDCRKYTAALLRAHPNPGDIDVIWGMWDDLALGAAQAVDDAGRKDISVVSVNGILPVLDKIRKGSSFVATVSMPWEDCCDIFIEKVKMIRAGKKLDTIKYYIDNHLVTRANVPPPGYFFNAKGEYPPKK